MSVLAIINGGFLARPMTATGRLDSVASTISHRKLRRHALRYRRALPAHRRRAFRATVAKKDHGGYGPPITGWT